MRADEPHHETGRGRRDRRLGRRRQDRQLRDEESHQRRLSGRRSIPIHPSAEEILGHKAYKSVKDVPGDDRRRGLRDSGEIRRVGAGRSAARRKFPAPCSFRRASPRPATSPGRKRFVEIGAQVQRAPDGAEHLRLLLHAEESVRDLLHRLRRIRARPRCPRSRGGIGMAIIGFSPLGEDGRLGDRRPRQQVRHRRRRSAHVLRAGRQHADRSRSTWRT